MKKSIKFLPLLSMGLVVVGCQDYDAGFTESDIKAKQYADNFTKEFGQVGDNQNWSMATVVNATIILPEVSDACKVSVYTSRPGSVDCKLVTSKNISSSSSISFDYPKNLSKVFVEVVDGNAVVISDYFSIENNTVEASSVKGVTRAGDCSVERVFVSDGTGTFNLPGGANNQAAGAVYEDDYYSEALSALGIINNYDVWQIPRNKSDENSSPNKTNGIYNLYTLSNYSYTKGDGNTWKNSDLAPIIGYGGVFEESCLSSLAAGEGCAREEWYEDLRPNEGIDFLLGDGGPVTLSLMYGATGVNDKFGYLYYQDGATLAEILSSPHYIVLDNAQPMNLLEYSNGGFTAWNKISEDILHGTQPNTTYTDEQKEQFLSYEVTGTRIPLVYFDEEGNSSYDFPENTHIVFFEMLEVGGSSRPAEWAGKIRYSRPDMNRFYGACISEIHSPKVPSVTVNDGDWRFITYSWGETVIAGMEDTTDDDMNDLLFSVKANITNKPKDINPETPKNLKWLVACEDLGSSFDYDFNDIVIGFEKKDVDGVDHLFLQPLAAGGTLPSVISYTGYSGSELKEIHQMLGAAAVAEGEIYGTIMSKFDADQIDLGECPTDIGTALKGLKIMVDGGSAENRIILENSFDEEDTTDTTPQMLLLPGGWDWPIEGARITSVYSNFVTWAEDATYTDWTKRTGAQYITNTWGK